MWVRKFMSDDRQKARLELEVFQEFVERSHLSIVPGSIEGRCPPEPDVLCEVSGEGCVAFELKGITDEAVEKAISHQLKWNSSEASYIRSGIPLDDFMRRARNRRYESEFPMELLFWKKWTAHSRDEIAPKIKLFFENNRQFRRVWFMGDPDETCEVVVPV